MLTTWEKVRDRFDFEDTEEMEAQVVDMIALATKRAEQHTYRQLVAAVKTMYLDGHGTHFLLLQHTPINEVISIHVDGTCQFDPGLEITGTAIQPDLGGLYRPQRWPRGVGNIKVVANVGYVTVPVDLEETAIQLVGYWLQSPQVSWLGNAAVTDGGFQTQHLGVMDLPFQVRNVWDQYVAVLV